MSGILLYKNTPTSHEGSYYEVKALLIKRKTLLWFNFFLPLL